MKITPLDVSMIDTIEKESSCLYAAIARYSFECSVVCSLEASASTRPDGIDSLSNCGREKDLLTSLSTCVELLPSVGGPYL